ncbi:hypothetical protein AMECASPLE_036673, partial [Ameca splendens]
STKGSKVPRSVWQKDGTDTTGRLITSLQPLRIHSSPSHPPRAPTLQECEVIIRQLFNENYLQSQEIAHVKALLKDIVLSKNITPEHHILSKTCLVARKCKPVEERKFSKLDLQSFPEKMYVGPVLGGSLKFKRSGPSHSGVVLPALKQNLSSNIANRHRRTHAKHRDHFKSTLH